ncbi:UNVERIFIED_CONTAM: hypothetical protein K2H54_019992 [Gekko kuhli]
MCFPAGFHCVNWPNPVGKYTESGLEVDYLLCDGGRRQVEFESVNQYRRNLCLNFVFCLRDQCVGHADIPGYNRFVGRPRHIKIAKTVTKMSLSCNFFLKKIACL